MRTAPVAAACLCAALLGAALAFHFARRPQPLPDPPALVVKVREVARLQTLDITLYKKLSFSPDPRPADGFWSSVGQWARYAVRPPGGRAIVFAQAHLSVDLRRLDASALRVSGRRVEVVLPKTSVEVELLPGETEVIGSNLDTAETAQLFALAREAFAREVEADPLLRDRARESARRTLRALFIGLGFTEVEFPDALPSARVN